jgi:hypothetical protein
MKKYLALLLLCLSCTPMVSRRSADRSMVITNKSGSISCIKSSCCWPYKHHRDIKTAAGMVCINEKVSAKQISEGGNPLTEVNLSFRVVYDETKIIK